jgi:[protein-PII] uridylyltransferase
MQEIFRKIEADAAARLPIPHGKAAAHELPRYKAFLKLETHRLLMHHRAGAGGLEICRGRSLILDLLLQHLWQAALNALPTSEQEEIPSVALVALGGYGRGELNPHSDIDFMFLHNHQTAGSQPLPQLAKLVDAILYPLWDVRVKVGHSVRTISECVKQANTDMQSKTALIEARLIVGDETLFQNFQKTLVKKCVESYEEAYIDMRLNDQAGRRAKFGNSASMQEPNIKNGCGGLRDYQNLLWMAFFKYRTRSLEELREHELVTDSERKQLQAAYDFLLRVRTEMHYHARRAMDVLSKNVQPAVAHNLGFRERSPSRRIEGFMREVYMHSRGIFLITRTLEQRLALLPRRSVLPRLSLRGLMGGRSRKAPPVDGFKFADGQIDAESDAVFAEDPRRLMRVFLYAQQRGLRLHPDLAQELRHQLSLADRAFLKDSDVRETFLSILNQPGNVASILRQMHEVGLLGRYVPEFGKLTCLVQHEFYHQYTADEHTLMCLEQLDRVAEGAQQPYQTYAPLFQSLERPFILYLAMLLHDVGKAQEGDHSEVGTGLAARVARRLGLDEAATRTLLRVIEHHLLLVNVSQRRDLDDPAVIRKVARQVEEPETLSMLTVHTFVDSMATSDKLWNGFKDSLLWTLHFKTMHLLSGGPEFIRAEERHREELREKLLRRMPAQVSTEEVMAHFDAMPARYFLAHNETEIAEDLGLAHRFMHQQISEEDSALIPVISWRDDLNRGCAVVKVCTWDRAGLFRKIAGSFSALDLNILGAQVFTRTDGIVVDTFFVLDARTGSLPAAALHTKFQALLTRALLEEINLADLIKGRKTFIQAYQAYSGEEMPTRVRFDNDSSDSRTIIDVEAEDRVGLLYAISQAMSELNLDISSAKISTGRGAAIDSFYVVEENREKVLDKARQQEIERKIRKAVNALA